MNDYICPISFINEKQVKSTELNELFVAGYRDKVCNDFSHSLLLDDIKKSFDFNNLTPDQSAWLNETRKYEYSSFNDSLLSYLVCNITDLTINTLILFMQKLSMPTDMIDLNLDQIINELKVREIVTNVVFDTFDNSFVRGDSIEQTFLSIDLKMDGIYSIFVARIFDAYVDAFIASICKAGGIKILFETLYALTYQSTEYPEESYSNMYVFCTSIIREAIDQETMNYRLGLKNIAANAAIMVARAPQYGINVSNPDYITSVDEYEKIGMFGPNCINELNRIESAANNETE